MVTIPEHSNESDRAAAIERRITACKASARVLSCVNRDDDAERVLQEVADLQAELTILRPHAA
ncbi:MAG: hypothetical protein ACK5MT_13470 [Actinomycetales bacterium]